LIAALFDVDGTFRDANHWQHAMPINGLEQKKVGASLECTGEQSPVFLARDDNDRRASIQT
jgi:hypothetical protein